MTKRILAMLLAVVMVVGLLPMNVFAGTADDHTKYTAQTAHTDAHICEHCVAIGAADTTPVWTALDGSTTTLPTAAGHYYLTESLEVQTPETTAISSGDVVLCLNGKTVTAVGSGKTDRFYNITGGRLFILDCTACLKNGAYTAGTFTGGSNSSFRCTSNNSDDKLNNALNIYDGIFTGNSGQNTGELIYATNKADIFIYGGKFTDNHAVGKGAGVAYLDKAACGLTVENAEISNNDAKYGGVVYAASNSTVEFKNCKIDNNQTTDGNGGVINMNGAGVIRFTGCTVTNNKAKEVTANNGRSGAVYSAKAAQVFVTDSTFSGNEGVNTAAIYTLGSITLENAVITGNRAGSLNGAVTLANTDAQTITLKGNTQITGNKYGDQNSTAVRNLYLSNDANKVAVDGLSCEDGKIGVTLAAGKGTFTDALTDTAVKSKFAADDAENLQIGVQDNKLAVEDKTVAPPTPPTGDTHEHTCQHCGGTDKVVWEAWGDDPSEESKLPGLTENTTKHYYLTKDLNVTAADISAGHVVLCLNGKTVTAVGQENNKADRFYNLTNAAELTIVDCHANEADRTKRGTFTGSSYQAFWTSGTDATKATGAIHVYAGIFDGNVSAQAGAVFCMQKEAKLNIHGGEFTNNVANGKNGGVIYTNNATNHVNIENAYIANNKANNGAVLYANSYTRNVVKNSVIENNQALTGNGGVFVLASTNASNSTKLTISSSEIRNNSAVGMGGVVYAAGKATITIDKAENATAGTTITGNSGAGAGVIYTKGAVTLDSAQITGNTTTDATNTYGAVTLANDGAQTITLKGNVNVSGNTNGDTTNPVKRNLYLANAANRVALNGLADTASVGVAMAGGMGTFAENVTDAGAKDRFASDVDGIYVHAQGNTLVLSDVPPAPPHDHHICGKDTCSDTTHTSKVYNKWGDEASQQTSLPEYGNYYLTHDVTLSETYNLENEKELNLCLNGHNIYIADGVSGRQFYLKGNAKLSITDCDEDGDGLTGALMNGTSGAIMSHQDANGAEVNLYGISLKNNSRGNAGGTLIAQGKTTFNLTDVEISGSSATGNGGVIYAQNDAKININGGSIHDNSATGNGGAIILTSKNNVLTVKNTEFKNNSTGKNGGVVYTEKACTISFNGCTFTQNHADKDEAGVAYLKTAKATFTDGTMEQNTARNGSALAVVGGTCTLDGVKIQNNHASSSYGAVHVNRSGDVKLILKGETVIKDNTAGSNETAQNVFMRYYTSALYLTVQDLTGDAYVGVTMINDRLLKNVLRITEGGVLEEDAAMLHSDNTGYEIKVKEDGNAWLWTGHEHCLYGHDSCKDHETYTWAKWTDSTKLPTTAGRYYLDVDVQLTGIQYIRNDVKICLNGHTVTAKEGSRLISVQKIDEKGVTSYQGVLDITDCTGNGKLTGGDSTFGGAVNVGSGATFNLYAGKIEGNIARGPKLDDQGEIEKDEDGNTVYTYSEGGAVYVAGGGVRYIYKVEEIDEKTQEKKTVIKVTTAEPDEGKYVENSLDKTNLAGGIFNMYGGEITGNYANVGGGVRVANPNGNAQGVKFDDKSEEVAKDAYDSKFIAQFNMYGGQIVGNESKAYGGAVAGSIASIKLMGGKITGNTSNSYGAVFAGTKTDLTVGGNIQILGNSMKGRAANLYLDGQGLVAMDNLAADARIGISVGKYDRVISKANDTDYSKNFVSDSPYRIISYRSADKVLYLANCVDHQHCDCAGMATGGCEHNSVVWTAWESNNSLPETDGYYYLVNDIKLNRAYNNISADVKLCLNGFTVTAKEGVRLLGIANEGVYSIADCQGTGKLTGGNNTFGGAVNVNAGGTLNLYGGIITGNQSSDKEPLPDKVTNMKGQGGAIYLQDRKATYVLESGEVTTTKPEEGKKYTVKYRPGGVLNMYGGTITGNKATLGGGIYASANTSLNIYGGTISGNTAVKYGGGTYSAGGITTNISNATIEGNTAYTGGAVYITGANSKLNIKNTTLSKNTAEGSGGAILVQSVGTVAQIDGCTIKDNKANDGGAIYASSDTVFTVSGGTISGNTAKNNAGAICSLRSTINLKSGTIKNNFAEKMGGAIFLSGGKLYQSGATISGNKTGTGTGGGAVATGVNKNKGVTYQPYIKISGGTISNNYGRHGGAILLQGSSKTVLDMTGGRITGNQAKVDGGAFYVSTHTTFNMTGGSISGNSSEGRAGGVFHNNSKGNYSGAELFDNNAKSSGGAVMLNGATTVAKMKNVKIYDCSASTGGAIVDQGKARLNLEKTEIYNCHSTTGSGGAIYVSYNAYLDFIDTIIRDCQSKMHGGGLYFANHTYINADGLTVQSNISEVDGGGIYTRSCSSVFKNTKLIGNKANGTAGGFYAANPAVQGVSGMIVKPDYKTGNVMENMEFQDNQATGQAGGLYVHKGNFVTLTNGSFTGNNSGTEGAAVYAEGDFIMNGMNVTGNTSKMDGYAVFLADVLYDGQSYTTGQNKMAGDVIIKDNQGGDMFMGETTTIAVLAEGLKEKTEIHVTLASGLLTNKIYGAYNYEGGDLVYVITYGDRSLTQPEYDETLANKDKEDSTIGDVLLYTGVGVFVLAVAAVVVLLILKKKNKKTPVADAAQE